MKFGERGFVFEQVDLRRGAGHVEVNDRLGLGWDSKSFFLVRISVARQQVIQSDGTEAESGLPEKMAAGDRLRVLQVDGGS